MKVTTERLRIFNRDLKGLQFLDNAGLPGKELPVCKPRIGCLLDNKVQLSLELPRRSFRRSLLRAWALSLELSVSIPVK